MPTLSRRALLVCGSALYAQTPSIAPHILSRSPENEATPVCYPNGTFTIFYAMRDGHIASVSSRDNGVTWLNPQIEFAIEGPPALGTLAFLDRDGDTHVWFLQFRGSGTKIAIDRMLDVWHARRKGSTWSKPQRIFAGYVGALRGIAQMPGGRLVLPVGIWVPGRPLAPPTGANEIGVLYSDDAGTSWKLSAARLTSPCVENYNGSNTGAVEPAVEMLRDGRVWMLFRTQTGFLYESFSRDGAEWTVAKPSQIRSSHSPAAFLRLRDGRLILLWNNCRIPPRHEGQGVYGGRDALHAAISADDGKSWRGFREVYRDPFRHQTPPKRGDRATAYPYACQLSNGRVAMVTGQGEGRRVILTFHPDWLLETAQRDDFSQGLEQWTAFQSVGPAAGWWRDRQPSANMQDGALLLHTAAVWNFPAGRSGTLTLTMRPLAGFTAGSIALGDEFFDPCDDTGEREALFHHALTPKELPQDRWTTQTWHWKTTRAASYLRLRAATSAANSGFLIKACSIRIKA